MSKAIFVVLLLFVSILVSAISLDTWEDAGGSKGSQVFATAVAIGTVFTVAMVALDAAWIMRHDKHNKVAFNATLYRGYGLIAAVGFALSAYPGIERVLTVLTILSVVVVIVEKGIRLMGRYDKAV